jgi:exopolysaccharide production protein ExoQ
MPPVLALFLTLAFIFVLFRRERRERIKVSGALWIPLIWLFLTGSRFASQWLSLGGGSDGSIEEGSPIDAAVFLSLIISGFYVLKQRGVNLSKFARNNRWLTIFLVYCLVSILWSDFPFTAFKRYIKILGHPTMALIVLTEPDPQEALRRLLKRLAYLLVPLSVLFIKYFPQYGRGFDSWTGLATNCGVALSKNELGATCMIFGVFFFWNALQAFKMKSPKARLVELLLTAGFLGMIWYLLQLSSSATSLTTMLLGMATVFVLGLRFVNKQLIGVYVVVAIITIVVAEPIFGIYATVVQSLGRNLTLTDRTDVWRMAAALQPNPIFGAGFESFWLGPRLEKLWTTFWWHPIQAHSGYVETYLNLGYVGVVMLAGQVIDTFRKIQIELLRRFEFARLRLGLLLAILVHNYTEAAFVAVAFIWTIFFLIAVDYPMGEAVRSKRLSEPVREGRETMAVAGD